MMFSAVLVSTLGLQIKSKNVEFFLVFCVQVIVVNVLLYTQYAEGGVCGVCGNTSGVECLTTKTFRPCFTGQTFFSIILANF